MERILFIYNPFSGKGEIKNYLYDIMQELNTLGAEIIIHPTVENLDAYRYISQNAEKFDLIVCSGGDGTLNETVAGIMNNGGKRPAVGYIPSGTTNDFARSLDIPKNMQQAARAIVQGKPQKIDVGTFNEKYFTYIAAIGAFTEVSYETPQNMKNILGHQAYVIEGVKKLTSIKPKHMIIETENETIEGDFIFGMISNAKSVGGYKGITGTDVFMNDGFLEVTFVKYPTNPLQLQNIATSLLMQNYKNDVVYFEHIEWIRVTTIEEQPWVLDGEFGGNLKKVEIGVKKQAIDIILDKEI